MPKRRLLTSCLREDAEYRKLLAAVSAPGAARSLPLLLTGLCEGASELLCAALCEDLPDLRPVLLVCPNDRDCLRLAGLLSSFGCTPAVFPARDVNFHGLVSSREYEHTRISTLIALQDGTADTVLTTPDALLSLTVPPEVLRSTVFRVRSADAISPEELTEKLVKAGYVRRDLAEGPGQFARRGGIVDVVTDVLADPSAPADSDAGRGIFAVRTEFFGDEIDRIGRYDTATQRVTENLDEFTVFPAREAVCDRETLRKIRDCVSLLLKKAEDPRVRQTLEAELSSVSAAAESGGDIGFTDKYFPLIYPQRSTLLDYLTDCPLVLVRGNAAVREGLKAYVWQMNEDAKKLTESLLVPGKYAQYCAPEDVFSDFCRKRRTLLTDLFAQGMSDRELGGLFGFSTKHSLSAAAGEDMLLEDIRTLADGCYRIVLMTQDAGTAKQYEAKLTEEGILARACSEPDGSDLPLSLVQPGTVTVLPSSPVEPFELVGPRIALLSLSGETGERRKKAPRHRRVSAARRILSFNDLHVGDYVVHESHGIGRYDGITTMTVDGVTRDYITIQYAGSDRLFLPADSLDRVTKYIGSKSDGDEVRLSRFGGTEWGRTKSRARSALRDIAKELIRLYAERLRRPGYAFHPDDREQKVFEDAFEFEVTEAQEEAVNEIKADMMRAAPMDRLLCGDVGYGKTEVALRAAYKAILDGKQVALLVPTTILALQHYNTARARFRDTAVNLGMLSRFVKPKEQKEVIARLARGDIDLIIGTHRLLSKDIVFRDLGLLIVDEEQRFGVAQKEKIKQRTGNIDVLSLSATPIPRTLNMAMSGIRDISLLDEAPGARLPVQTYVLEHSDVIIAEAIRRELRRGGQVFYLYNFVESIDSVAARLRTELPEANIVVAHGKMDKETLEDIWRDMTDGLIDVLVSTTIIESGVDVPNANTLIVQNAHRLGLSQLHQLRGRVGRSPRRAYAYFTFPPDRALSEISQKRLQAIREYAEFGAGFQIAMRDLELRGAGSVLGAEQSGHLDEIGYDLYIKLLGQAILEEKGEKVKEEAECRLSLSVSAFLPDSYIPSAPQRMALYKRLAHLGSRADADDFTDELLDRFGEPPEPVCNLVEIALLRARARDLGITDIAQNGHELRLALSRPDPFAWQEIRPLLPARMTLQLHPSPCAILTLPSGTSPVLYLGAVLDRLEKAAAETAQDAPDAPTAP